MATATCREDAAGPDGADAINADLPALACPFCGGVLPHGESICPHCGCLRPTTRRPAATLTGRSQEIEVLRARIDGARAGQGAVIGIAGPAGIGKTRLAEEAIAYAKEQGCADFFIRGFEPSANLPYWALIEALHFDLDADQDIDPRAGLPDLVQALRGAQELPAGSTTGFEARDSGINTRIYEAATAVMRTITTTRPLVVVADDLQWFDVPTLNLLRYAVRLAKTLPLVIVCSYREDGEGASAWRPVLEDAAREGLLTELRLEQLDPAAARRLALASAPAPLADRAIEEVLRLAEGVPFYITQLAYAYAVPHGEGRPALPAALRGFTEQRLAHLSSGCHALVQAVALVGRECPLDLLTVVAAMPLPDLAAALDEALAAHVLVEREAAGQPRYDVSHALLREAAARELSALARARLHLTIAEALHGRRQAGGRVPAGEIAEHYLGARPFAPPDQTLTYLRVAADEAMALGAPEQAARFLAAAVELMQAQEADTAEIIHARVRLLEAYGRAGDTEAAEREAAEALAYWQAAGDARAQAEVHALLAEHLNPRLRPRDVIAQADAGLMSLGEERSALAARLRYLRAHARHMLDDNDDLLLTAGWLAASGFEPAEPAAELWSRLLRVLWHLGNEPDSTRALALCREAIDHTRRTGDRRAQAMTRLWEAEILNRDVRPRQALESLDEAQRLARETGSAPFLVDAGALRAEALLQLARWQELEQVVDETLPALLRLRSTYFGYTLIAAHAWSRRLRGLPWEPPHGLEIRFPDSQLFLAAYRTNAARQIVEFSRPDERTGRLLDWLAAAVPRAGAGIYWATAGIPLLGTLALAGRRDDVAARYEGAVRFPRFLQYATYGPLEAARAATLLKKWDAAEAHFDEAVRLATAEGLRTALARTLVERGNMYRLRGRRGDRARAVEVLRRAEAICAETGLHPDEARARDLLQRLGPVAPPALPAGLTPREAEVLHLLAAGRTNRQIADALVISEKTVEQHLLNIYQKIQVDSRAQAVAFAYAHGLTG